MVSIETPLQYLDRVSANLHSPLAYKFDGDLLRATQEDTDEHTCGKVEVSSGHENIRFIDKQDAGPSPCNLQDLLTTIVDNIHIHAAATTYRGECVTSATASVVRVLPTPGLPFSSPTKPLPLFCIRSSKALSEDIVNPTDPLSQSNQDLVGTSPTNFSAPSVKSHYSPAFAPSSDNPDDDSDGEVFESEGGQHLRDLHHLYERASPPYGYSILRWARKN